MGLVTKLRLQYAGCFRTLAHVPPGAAGYFDLCHDGGTGNFGGFRSSCTNNLIVADGILAAGLHTHLHLLLPESVLDRTDSHAGSRGVDLLREGGTRKIIQRVGINLGRPAITLPTTARFGWNTRRWRSVAAVPVLVTGKKVALLSPASSKLQW